MPICCSCINAGLKLASMAAGGRLLVFPAIPNACNSGIDASVAAVGGSINNLVLAPANERDSRASVDPVKSSP